MKYLLSVIGLALSIPVMAEDQTDYASMLRDHGHKYCAPVINNITNHLLDQDGATVSHWSPQDPDKHGGALLGSKHYPDGQNLVTVAAVPNKLGGCDANFTYVFPTDKSCSFVRETAIKDWKYYGDLAGLAVYANPTSGSLDIVLMPVQQGCVLVKSGFFHFDEDAVKSMSSLSSPDSSQ